MTRKTQVKGRKEFSMSSWVRQQLFPYGVVFEDVVLRSAVRTKDNRLSEPVAIELRRKIEEGLHALIGFVPHPWLIKYGLLLCCYHARQAAGNDVGKAQRVMEAVRLIRYMFAKFKREDSQATLWS